MNAIQTTRNPSHLLTSFVPLLVSGLVALLLGAILALPVLAAGSSTWTTTASMHVNRTNATATLLPNGLVLVAGGCCNGEASLDSAELYNPTTGTWTTTGSMNTPRTYANAVLLQNGQVLVAGGVDYDNFGNGFILTSAELYNPTTGTWTTTGSMNHIHEDGYTPNGPTMTRLANGQVLVVGGCCNPATGVGNNPIGDLYNPASGTWNTTSPMNVARNTPVSALLSSGKVLVAGGSDDQGRAITSAELYDPAINSWSFTGSMPAALDDTATVLSNGMVLVTGNDGSGHSAELYNPTAGTWSLTGSMNTPRGDAQAVLLQNGKVLVAGGEGGNPFAVLTSAELYNPATGTWTTTGSLQHARFFHTMTLLQSGQVLAAGGQDSTPAFLNSAELYTP
jgi:hypothetical protein